MYRKWLRVSIALLAAVFVAPALAQQTYVLTDIGPRTAAPLAYIPPMHINASGNIAGFEQSSTTGENFPYSWTPSSPNASTGTYALLPVPSGSYACQANGINGAGQICGFSVTKIVSGKKPHLVYTVIYTPLVWQPNGTFTVLLNGGKTFGGQARSINDAGEVVGDFGLWANGMVYPLPGFTAASINKSGQVAGFISESPNTGYLWTPTTATGTTGTYVTFPFLSSQVNDFGEVAGAYLGPSAIFTIAGDTQYISTSTSSGATCVNSFGQVVGYDAAGAFIWDSANGIRHLNTFTIVNGAGWNLTVAEGINDYGQIVGYGKNAAGALRDFLFTPQ
jgi:hypothetical protein